MASDFAFFANMVHNKLAYLHEGPALNKPYRVKKAHKREGFEPTTIWFLDMSSTTAVVVNIWKGMNISQPAG